MSYLSGSCHQIDCRLTPKDPETLQVAQMIPDQPVLQAALSAVAVQTYLLLSVGVKEDSRLEEVLDWLMEENLYPSSFSMKKYVIC